MVDGEIASAVVAAVSAASGGDQYRPEAGYYRELRALSAVVAAARPELVEGVSAASGGDQYRPEAGYYREFRALSAVVAAARPELVEGVSAAS